MQKKNRLFRFLVIVVVLIFGWLILYDVWLNKFDDFLTYQISLASGWLLNLAGYDVTVQNTAIIMNGEELVRVGAACNAMVLMALFAGFIIAFPGPLVGKMVFIPLGILIINILNLLRVSLLALNAFYSEQTLDFNHKYTFTLVVYAAIFYLWMIWVQKFSKSRTYVPATSNA
jgi:exosortase family protein XrtF